MRYALLVVVLLAVGVVPDLAEARERLDPPLVVRDPLGRELDSALQDATHGMWWGAVLVAKEGTILLAKGYGYADYADRPNDANTLFEIASTSKQFTAAAVLHLVQSGRLTLETTLGSLWPRIPADKRDITVHALLTHTSGLSHEIGVPYDSPLAREAYIEHILRADVADGPGETFAYNNAGYAILAAIVEKVSGVTLEAYSKKNLFEPAGLKSTGFIGDKRLRKRENVAARSGPGPQGQSAVDWHWGYGYRGMGGAVTTLHDLFRWDQALRGDEILDEETKAILYEPVLESYACGWRVGTSPSGGIKVEHSGGVQGFTCQLERHLEDDVVIAVLTNNEGKPFEIAKVIRERLWPPVTMTAHLDASPYALSVARAAELGEGARWQVEARGASRRLTLVDGKGHAAATMDLPPEVVKRVLNELRYAIRMRERDDDGGAPALEAGIYLVSHRDGVVHDLRESLTLTVMPEYSGRSARGEPIVDKRATLVLVDQGRRSWPVMVKMNRKAAQALAQALGDG